jgi:hypothetical protein
MKICFFTFVTESYSQYIEFDLFEKSFKHFHPDIPLFVLRDKEIESLKQQNSSLDMYNIKATAAKTFYDEYDLVVNIDADHFIFSRLDEIISGDYDVACPSNVNNYENVDIFINTYQNNMYNVVASDQYVQAGLIASTSKQFWNAFETSSIKHAQHMTCKDNDVLNLVLQFGNYKFKLLDGDWLPASSSRNSFYGCSSLSLEHLTTIINNIPCINGVPLKCYHVARGHIKPKFKDIFNTEIVNWFYDTIK